MGLVKFAKQLVGIQAYQDRKEAQATKSYAEYKYNQAKSIYDEIENKTKKIVGDFGKTRLNSLKNTVGRFLTYLKDMEQKNKEKSYEILDDIQIPQETVNELGNLEINATTALAGTATAGALGAVAAFGAASAAPAAVTGAVAAFAHAGSGAAIASLHGAAATNAVLAWLGGGTIASGGGGMAAGAATLASITTAATAAAGGFVAIAAAGLVASYHYSKKLTEAKEYEKNVDIAVEQMESAEVILKGIQTRATELKNVTEELEQRASRELDYLEPLVPDFDFKSEFYAKRFQKCGLLIKAIGELAKTPLLDDKGDVTAVSQTIITKTHSLLNSEL